MIEEFACDLKVARRKSGLTQADCAHLLGVDASKVSNLEAGKCIPTVPEICALSVIYGRSFESLFSEILEDARRTIRERLVEMPVSRSRFMGSFNRTKTIEALQKHLEVDSPSDDAA